MTIDTRKVIYDTEVTCICDKGHQFIDGDTIKVLQCLENGTWSENLIETKGLTVSLTKVL